MDSISYVFYFSIEYIFWIILQLKFQLVSRSKHSISFTKTSKLIQYKEIIAVLRSIQATQLLPARLESRIFSITPGGS